MRAISTYRKSRRRAPYLLAWLLYGWVFCIAAAPASAPRLDQYELRVTRGAVLYMPKGAPPTKRIPAGHTQKLQENDDVRLQSSSQAWIRLKNDAILVDGPLDFVVPTWSTTTEGNAYTDNTQIAGRDRGISVQISSPRPGQVVRPDRFSIAWAARGEGRRATLTIAMPGRRAGVTLNDIPRSRGRIEAPILGAWLEAQIEDGYRGAFVARLTFDTGDSASVIFYCSPAARSLTPRSR